MQRVRAKFMVASVTPVSTDGSIVQVTAHPVTPSQEHPVAEDERFHKYTPSGLLQLTIDNPPAAEFFKGSEGKGFYVDITPAS